jgi:nucleolin
MDAKVVYDRDSGRSKGFGFVTYSSAEEVDNAIDSLNGAVSISFPFFLKICACSSNGLPCAETKILKLLVLQLSVLWLKHSANHLCFCLIAFESFGSHVPDVF